MNNTFRHFSKELCSFYTPISPDLKRFYSIYTKHSKELRNHLLNQKNVQVNCSCKFVDNKGPNFEWPDTTLGFLGFKDARFPMPGYIGPTEGIVPPNHGNRALTALPNVRDKSSGISIHKLPLAGQRLAPVQGEIAETFSVPTEALPTTSDSGHQSSGSNPEYETRALETAATTLERINIGVIEVKGPLASPAKEAIPKPNPASLEPHSVTPVLQRILAHTLPAERHIQTLFHARAILEYDHKQDVLKKIGSYKNNLIECTVYDCPHLIKRDFNSLFPMIDVNSRAYLTAITLVFQNVDPSKFPNFKEEWKTSIEECLSLYMAHICDQFHLAGYWADFVQSVKGKQASSLTNFPENTIVPASELITNDIYKRFSLVISEGDTCKTIKHTDISSDGSMFHGTIFTTAPYFSSVIKTILKKGDK